MKIAIIELETHPHFLDFQSQFFKGHAVRIYVSRKLYRTKLQGGGLPESVLEIQRENESITAFLGRMRGAVLAADCLFNNTATHTKSELIESGVLRHPCLILTLHNINEWLCPDYGYALKYFARKHFWPTVGRKRRWLKQAVRTVRQTWRYRKQHSQNRTLLEAARVINLFHPQMEQYLRAVYPAASEKRLISLPYRYPVTGRMERHRPDPSVLSLAVMGRVKRSRGYVEWLSALRTISVPTGHTLQLHFLGSCRDEVLLGEIGARLLELPDGVEVATMPTRDFIPQKTVDARMQSVDWVVSLFESQSEDRYSNETYGVSRASGSDFDAFYYGKPFFVPDWYEPIGYVKPMYHFYRDPADLCRKIEAFFDSEKFTAAVHEMATIPREALLGQFEAEWIKALPVRSAGHSK